MSVRKNRNSEVGSDWRYQLNNGTIRGIDAQRTAMAQNASERSESFSSYSSKADRNYENVYITRILRSSKIIALSVQPRNENRMTAKPRCSTSTVRANYTLGYYKCEKDAAISLSRKILPATLGCQDELRSSPTCLPTSVLNAAHEQGCGFYILYSFAAHQKNHTCARS